jgi:hypothetical protein
MVVRRAGLPGLAGGQRACKQDEHGLHDESPGYGRDRNMAVVGLRGPLTGS